MARKRAAKRATASEALSVSPADVVPVRVLVDPTDDTPVHYANHAEVSLSTHEVSVSFVRVPSKLSSVRSQEAKATGSLTFEPAVQVILPPTLLPGLIKALTITKEQYEQKYGEIRDPSVENE